MMAFNTVVCILLFLGYLSAADVGEKCVPNNSIADGVCTLVTDCAEALRLIRKKNFHQFQRCGFSGDQEVVCCPQSSENKFGPTESTSRLTQRIADRECTTNTKSNVGPLDLHIIGGELAALGEFPHMVAIGYDTGDDAYDFKCGGALISDRFVLTAAHCTVTLERIEPSVVRTGVVLLGSKSWNEDTDYRIAEILVYPNYTRREQYHDIALLRLEKPVSISNVVNPACLYTSDDDPPGALTITGWGTTNTTTETRSNMLLKANVTAVAIASCSEHYQQWRKLPRGIMRTQMCAGDRDGARDACQGDSGGPLQAVTSQGSQYRVVGVTSFGRGCGTAVPGVYTRVARYLDWIEPIVWPTAR